MIIFRILHIFLHLLSQISQKGVSNTSSSSQTFLKISDKKLN